MSFLREKFRPRGGPDGGDGGDGGSVVFRVDGRLGTLLDFKLQKHLRAGRGRHGEGHGRNGARGRDLVVRVPAGTLVTEPETGEIVADLISPGSTVIVARGGRGGRGNRHFATPSRRAPRQAEAGRPGEERRLRLELRLIADVGLIGLPNAGKSTLLAAVSAARPRVASYPFTTLVPHLGVIHTGEDGEGDPLVMADIPGLIAGAHAGAGLGLRFLRHLSRTSLLLHLLDAGTATAADVEANFETVNGELTHYGEDLGDRPQIVVATKVDLPAARAHLTEIRRVFRHRGLDLHAVSARTGEGLGEMLAAVGSSVRRLRDRSAGSAPVPGSPGRSFVQPAATQEVRRL